MLKSGEPRDFLQGGWRTPCPELHLNPTHQTYQLWITVHRPLHVRVGRLGLSALLPGRYIYTGSARRHLAARLARHLAKDKRRRWHIDHLLLAPRVVVSGVRTVEAPECDVNRTTPGTIAVPSFGASDCRTGCGSHLKYLGDSGTDSVVGPP